MLELGIEVTARKKAIRAVRTIAIATGLQATEAGTIVDIVGQAQPPDGARNDQQRDSNADHQQRCAQILCRMFDEPGRAQHNAAQCAGHASQRKYANHKG